MPIEVKNKPNFFTQLDKPKIYLVYIIYDKYVSWDFCMRIMIDIFHKSYEEADAITHEILTNGEGLCGAYMFEIAETKAKYVEELAKKENFSMQCLLEEV